MTVNKKVVDREVRKTDAATKPSTIPPKEKSIIAGTEKVEGGERVDQIREILFGAQRQEYERRLAGIEELLVQNISELSKETTGKFANQQRENDKKFARLEELLVKNIEDIGREFERKLDSHKAENDKRFQQLEQHFNEVITEFKKETGHQFNLQRNEHVQNFSSLEEKLGKVAAEINKRMDADTASLTRDIAAAKSELVRNLEQLDSAKMDRTSLAKLLHNTATGVEGKEHKADSGGK